MATPPRFPFEPPPGYRWLVDRGHVGFEARTPLQPWHYLETPIDIQKHWPSGPSKVWIDMDGLHANFHETGFRTELHVRLTPTVQVLWSSIRTE